MKVYFKNSDTDHRNIDLETLIQGKDISKLHNDTAETLDKEIIVKLKF